MTEIAQFKLPDGGVVLVEVEEVAGVTRAGRGERVLADARETFESAFAQVKAAASIALDQFARLPSRPDEVELKFGVKLDTQVGAIIAQTGAQAQFEVALRWQKDSGVRTEDEQSEEPVENSTEPA